MTQATRQHTEQRDFASPDEVRAFDHGRLELLRIGDSEIGRLVLQPGWRWSEHVKPIAGTELCEAPHFQYHVAGTLRIKAADGTEFDASPGQVTSLPAGHDAWVIGEEEVVVVDWWGASNYARLRSNAIRSTGPPCPQSDIPGPQRDLRGGRRDYQGSNCGGLRSRSWVKCGHGLSRASSAPDISPVRVQKSGWNRGSA
jgi:hypothetical protein